MCAAAARSPYMTQNGGVSQSSECMHCARSATVDSCAKVMHTSCSMCRAQNSWEMGFSPNCAQISKDVSFQHNSGKAHSSPYHLLIENFNFDPK